MRAEQMPQPQQRKADRGNGNIGIEDHPCIAGGKIVGRGDLIDVAGRGPEQKQRRPNDRREAKIEAAAAGEEADRLAKPTSA